MREMKDSGVPWIGEIPKDWNIMPFSAVVSQVTTGLNPRDNFQLSKEDEYYYVTIRNYKDGQIFLDENCDRISPDAWKIIQQRSDLQEGDILFASISKDAQCYIVKTFPSNWNINESVFSLRGKSDVVNVSFLYYSLVNPEYYKDLRLDATGTTFQSIKQNKLKHSRFPVPNLKEQKRIADFLNSKCAEIDSILEKTRESIDGYKKLKQSVITEAVTKGIRRNRPMKDSGSVWFTSIPINWDFKRLKYLFKIEKRIAGETSHTVLAITQRGVLPKNMDNGNGQFAEDYSNYQLVNPGDFAMNHMDLLTGWVDISRYSGVTSPDYRVFTITDKAKCHPAYYLYFMQMCYMDRIFYGLGQGVSGMGRWRLQADKFLNFRIPVPPMEEQHEIASYLDEKCAAIDSLITSKEALITELEAYKKSLIYEYVTGKKEV